MKTITFYYNSASETIPKGLVDEVLGSLETSDYIVEQYSIGELRDEFIRSIKRKGWSDEILLNKDSKISITSEKECVGLCLQTGNVSRVYADLLKLQNLYVQSKIVSGILIVPTKDCAKQYTSNSATYERLVRELSIFSQVITIPMLVVGFYN